jgi:hypothetical protein
MPPYPYQVSDYQMYRNLRRAWIDYPQEGEFNPIDYYTIGGKRKSKKSKKNKSRKNKTKKR